MTLPEYRADSTDDVERFLADAQTLQHPGTLPFLRPTWLRAWYATVGARPGVQPLLVTARDRTGRPLAMLPLVRQRDRGLTVASFADGSIVDYVSPLLAPDWAGAAPAPSAAKALWAALRPRLAGCDLLQLHKLLREPLPEMGSTSNPLVLALPTKRSLIHGNAVTITTGWEEWRHSLGKHTRKELERAQRVFERLGATPRFEAAIDSERALVLFESLERQQSARLRVKLGDGYALDDPAYREFHRRVIRDGLADGSVFVHALVDGDEVVSALFGVANAYRSISLRQSVGLERWRACSPGRLLHEWTGRHMHAHGRIHFDLGIGDYFHKRVLHMRDVELVDAMVPLTLRGRPRALAWALRRSMRESSLGQRWRARRARARPAARTGESESGFRFDGFDVSDARGQG